MASKKEESAFNLLKMYDDDDDEMEDAEEDQEEIEKKQSELKPKEEAAAEQDDDEKTNEHVIPNAPPPMEVTPSQQLSANSTPNWRNLRPPTPQQPPSSMVEGVAGFDGMRHRREKPAIVDYGHDDVAMSPEPEEGEILSTTTGQVTFGEEIISVNELTERTPGIVQTMTPNYQVDSPQSFAQAVVSQTGEINDTTKELDADTEEVNTSDKDAAEIDPLDKFLPTPPVEKCPDELQEKINKFLAYKRQGKIFNVEVRNRKDYRNPDFLRHAVRYQEIDEIGSNLSKDVFDPHGYDKSDYYDAIEADMKREMERKEQERKKSQKVDFVSGGTQAAVATAAQKATLPSPSVPNLPSGGLQSGSTDASTREGRHNKKSKWDKVDGDRKNLSSGGQDAMSAVGAHAAMLSAANAGAGYALFAQQKRREAEGKRSGDRKVERRS